MSSKRRRRREQNVRESHARCMELELQARRIANSVINTAGADRIQAIRFASDPEHNVTTLAVVVNAHLVRDFERLTFHRAAGLGRRIRETRQDRLAIASKLLGLEALKLNPDQLNIRLVSPEWVGLAHGGICLSRQAA